MHLKAIILSIVTVFSLTTLSGQCIVEAGGDRNVCPDEIQDGAQLYGQILSGEVIELIWEAVYYDPTLEEYYYASEMLNDTSILEPIVEQHFEKTVQYFLTGITPSGESCVDSVTLNFSDWRILTIDKIVGKAPSDTVILRYASESNWPHIQYEWSPNYMISDTTIREPRAWNDTTVLYNLIITDSLGCSFDDGAFRVYVTTSSTGNPELSKVNIYPNPASSTVSIDMEDRQFQEYRLYDQAGNVVRSLSSFRGSINLEGLSAGVYLLQLMNRSEESITAKLIIR